MKVILLDDVKKHGKKGDVIEVAEGYGRNYLLPNNLAKEATTSNLNKVKQKKKVEAHRAAQRKDEAILAASQLEKVVVKMSLKIGEDGKAFGSISSKDVAEALSKQTGLEIDKRKIEMKENIKAPGRYIAVAKLHKDIAPQFTVDVAEA